MSSQVLFDFHQVSSQVFIRLPSDISDKLATLAWYVSPALHGEIFLYFYKEIIEDTVYKWKRQIFDRVVFCMFSLLQIMWKLINIFARCCWFFQGGHDFLNVSWQFFVFTWLWSATALSPSSCATLHNESNNL